MAYRYSSLDDSRCEIRLLTILPGMLHNPLRGYLEVCRLTKGEDPPPFEALSYHWGDPAPAASILINGCEQPIARNLDVALRHLRFLGRSRVLWIDAVCINQADVTERNWQILAMDAVYSRAHRVVVWLGPGDPETDTAMDAMGATESQAILGAHSAAIPVANPAPGAADIDCVLARPWWRRLWVVQEFVLAAEDPLIVCGYKELAWGRLRSATDVIVERRRGEGLDDQMANTMFPMLLDSLRETLHPDQNTTAEPYTLNLTEVILHLLDFRAANPRDKIYACLGLLDPAMRQALAPDYNKSVLQAYTDMARQILATLELPFFSAFSFERHTDDEHKDWPSWVPDVSRMAIWTPRNPHCFLDAYGWCQLGPRRRPAVIREEAVQKRVAFAPLPSRKLICSVAGFVFDAIDATVQLLTEADLLCQVVGPLHDMACDAAARPFDPDHLYAALERDTDVAAMIAGGERPAWQLLAQSSNTIVREQAKRYGITLPDRYRVDDGEDEDDDPKTKDGSDVDRDRRWDFADTRCFFTTKLGFSGICTEPARVGDVVTVMPGERAPVVLRPQPEYSMVSSASALYTVVGAAHVGPIQCDNQVAELCLSGKLEEVVFDLM